MQSSEIPVIGPQEKTHTILGTLSILIEGKDGLRHKNVLLVEDNSEGAQHPFRAIDPLTEDEVELTKTRLYDAYLALDRPIPRDLETNVGKYYKIRVDKKRALSKKAKSKNTPTEH